MHATMSRDVGNTGHARGAIAAKAAGILAFALLTNDIQRIDDRVAELIRNNEGYLQVVAFFALWLACLAGMLATGLLERLRWRVVFALPLLAGAIVGSAYDGIAGTGLDYDQAWLLREEILLVDAVLSFHPAPVVAAVLPALLGAAAILFPLRSPVAMRVSEPGVCAAGVSRWLAPITAGTPFLLILGVIVVHGGYGAGSLPVQHTVPALFLTVEIERLAADSERGPLRLTPDGASAAPPHVVLLIDESVRGDYLDLNVPRGTTPVLLRHRDRIANFGHAVAATNCSASTNLVLRTGAMPARLMEEVRANPYVWSYARRAGMRTVYIHPPVRGRSRGNYMLSSEELHIDEFFVLEGETRLERDLDGVDLLRDLTSRPEPHFIMLLKTGIHFPFEGRYPADGAKLRSELRPEPPSTEKALLEDSYGNAVAWNVDQFFEKLLSEVGFDDTVLLYTSDHGQNLLDNGHILTHCSTDGTSPYEGLVPMFAVTSHAEWRDRFEQAAALNLNRTSHFNLFATLLVLFGYDHDRVLDAGYAPSLLDRVDAEYGFATGVLPYRPVLLEQRPPPPMHRIPREILDRAGRTQ